MAEGGLCSICFAGSLFMQAGMLVCDACGSTVQEFAEETQEFQTGISDARFFRQIQSRSQPAVPIVVQELEPPKISEGLKAYAVAVQSLLKAQVNFLCCHCGVTERVEEVVKMIWFKELSSSKILEPSFVSAIEELAESRRVPDGRFQGFNLLRDAAQDKITTALPYSITLSIIVLACWLVREAIGPLEVVRYALHGRLPYLDFSKFCKDKIMPTKICTIDFLHPTGLPLPYTIHMMASKMANSYGIVCPPINAGLWLRYYVARMDLDEEVAAVAMTLYTIYDGAGKSCRFLSCNPYNLHPWGYVMAYLVVAIRLCYPMDGCQAVLPGAIRRESALDWLSWANSRIKTAVCFYPLTTIDAIRSEYTGTIDRYTKYLNESFFNQYGPPTGLEELKPMLKRMENFQNARQINQRLAEPFQLGEQRTSLLRRCKYRFIDTSKYIDLEPELAAIVTACSMEVFSSPTLLLQAVGEIEDEIRSSEAKLQNLLY